MDLKEATETIFARLGKDIRLATPLGLGKPNDLLNLIYERAKRDSSQRLSIYTALSLRPPSSSEDLGTRFLKPFADRQWGKGYPLLQYNEDAIAGRLPKNIRVHEFYFQAGAALHSEAMQRTYQSINYTHVPQSILQANVQVIVQLIAKNPHAHGARYSLSCNPDLTLDVADLYKQNSKKLMIVGVVHPELPFLSGDASVGEDFFDLVVEDPAVRHALFALPRTPIGDADHAIGFYASQLIKDDGTLQIGIGSLSEAVSSSLIFRQQSPLAYRELVDETWKEAPRPLGLISTETFQTGLYGLSELVTDGFMHLRNAGILKRHVRDERTGVKTYLHGAFFLGSKEFYSWLNSLQGDDFTGLRMGRVSKVNDLYDPDELLLRHQRKNPRFLNTCMQVTLLGGAASETLENGRVVSGVGGQYNFVSMSHELRNSRSILMLRSTRVEKGRKRSNIVWSHGHLTIPRHLRDIVITEYGIADVLGKTDEETIQAILNVTDSDFQSELAALAKQYGKLARGYEIPRWARSNRPPSVKRLIQRGRKLGTFKPYPFGSDFTPAEERLSQALQRLQRRKKMDILFRVLGDLVSSQTRDSFSNELARMGLQNPRTFSERSQRRLLLSELGQD